MIKYRSSEDLGTFIAVGGMAGRELARAYPRAETYEALDQVAAGRPRNVLADTKGLLHARRR